VLSTDSPNLSHPTSRRASKEGDHGVRGSEGVQSPPAPPNVSLRIAWCNPPPTPQPLAQTTRITYLSCCRYLSTPWRSVGGAALATDLRSSDY
jgi:hypothetical protein